MTKRPTNETISLPVKLEDMRLFAEVAASRSFTAAARRLGVPKQTLSRRVAGLERALDVQLLHRTTRRLHLTDAGAAYAERCAEIARLADDANRAVTATREEPRGVLRVTADPVFGDAFVGDVVLEYAERWPEVALDVVLTRRRVDLVAEGFDVAFRVGAADDAHLTARRLGPARVRYCASPRYLARRGSPSSPGDLGAHDCLVTRGEGAPVKWPFRGKRGVTLVPVTPRISSSSFAMTYGASLRGLGIALCPEFVCAEDIAKKRLVSVLDAWTVDVGDVWLLYPAARYLTARVRAFLDLVDARLAKRRPWVR